MYNSEHVGFSFSVLIATLNEEHDLQSCLDSIHSADDIIVYDSCSTDKTRVVAENAGARVIVRPNYDASKPFGGNESEHRNWALQNIDFKHKWVFVLDADERLTPELIAECNSISNSESNEIVSYDVLRRDFLEGKHLKYVQQSPWFTRFFIPACASYQRLVNPVVCINGKLGRLRNTLNHYPFSKGVSHWISRHNHYSSLEAQQLIGMKCSDFSPSLRTALFSTDKSKKRLHLKFFYYLLPFRPLIKFFLLYVIKRGFLDGRVGLRYSMMILMYEYMISLKLQELTRPW